jgi:hypothetical protein
MKNCEIKLAQAQNIARRTLLILDDNNFWDNTAEGEFWESSLHRDLTKLAEGKELKAYEVERKLMCNVIKELEKENKCK